MHLCPEMQANEIQCSFINSAINKILRNIDNIDAAKNTRDDSSTIMVPLPFKDQQSANSVKKQMQILSANMGVQIKPVCQTKEIGQVLAPKEGTISNRRFRLRRGRDDR